MNTIVQLKNKINKTEILFFDLDGTLINTEPLYFRFWKEGCSYFGYQMKDEEALNMRSLNKDDAIRYLSSISGGKLDYYKVKEKRIEFMIKYLETHPIKLKDGAIEILSKFRKEEKKVYIVTANTIEKATRILDMVGLTSLVDGVISAKDVKRGKPHPDVYLKACEVVGVKPNEVVVFEDSPNGLKSSHSAGCYTVMVEDMTPYEKDMDYVDFAISSLQVLL